MSISRVWATPLARPYSTVVRTVSPAWGLYRNYLQEAHIITIGKEIGTNITAGKILRVNPFSLFFPVYCMPHVLFDVAQSRCFQSKLTSDNRQWCSLYIVSIVCISEYLHKCIEKVYFGYGKSLGFLGFFFYVCLVNSTYNNNANNQVMVMVWD